MKALSDTRIKNLPDAEVILTNNEHKRLSELWVDRPLMITLFFSSCTGSCNPFLSSLKQAVEENGGLGTEYDILTLSIDPKDTLDDVKSRAKALGIPLNKGWYFGVASPEDIAAIASSINFWYRYDIQREQFDHPSLIAAVKNGKILRVLISTAVSRLQLNELVLDVTGRFVPFYSQPGKKALLSCFQVDPTTNKVRFDWGMLILIFPGALALVIVLIIFTCKKKKTTTPN